MIKKVRTMHHVWRDYQAIREKAKFDHDPRVHLLVERGSFLGRDHYYYLKGDEVKSLVDIPEGMSGIIHNQHWELCNPREYFSSLREADDFIRILFDDHEMEEIDYSESCITQDEVRKMFGMKEWQQPEGDDSE